MNKNGKVACFDVDETLIYWWPDKSNEELSTVTFEHQECVYVFGINELEVERLRQFSLIGYTVILWSQSGEEWASRVAKALWIERFVDIYLTKPDYMIDDKSPLEWTTHLLPMRQNGKHNSNARDE